MAATYSTTASIRDDAWFAWNTYIVDASIDIQRTRAYALINSYVGTRYTVPSLADSNFIGSPASQLLESIEITIGGAYLLIKEYGPAGRDTDKDWYRRLEDVKILLSEIRDGKISLFGNDGHLLPTVQQEDQSSGTIRAYTTDEPPRFSVDDNF